MKKSYRILDEKEIFQKGDLVVMEKCTSCDGDRSTFQKLARPVYLRQIETNILKWNKNKIQLMM